MKKSFFFTSFKNKILFFVLIFCCLIGFVQASQKTWVLIQKDRESPPVFLGGQFFGLQQVLKGETHIGYWSDLSPDDTLAQAIFAQTQYALAPMIVDTHLTHRYTIINAQNHQNAINKVKELNLVPLVNNHAGLILAVK